MERMEKFASVLSTKDRKGWWFRMGIGIVVLLFLCWALIVFWQRRSSVAVNVPWTPEPSVTPTATSSPTVTPIPTATSTATPTLPPTRTPTPSFNLEVGSTFDRKTNRPYEDPAADAVQVTVDCAQGKFRICIAFRKPFARDAYSYAVLVGLINPQTNRGRAFQFQVHAGREDIGEIVGQGRVAPIKNGRIVYDFERGVLCIEFDDLQAFLQSIGLKSGDTMRVGIEVYHMPTQRSVWSGDQESKALTLPPKCFE